MFKFPSESHQIVTGTSWSGGCGDSFCASRCNSPHCSWQARLGNSPDEHNKVVQDMKAQELVAARQLVKEADKTWTPAEKIEKILGKE